MKRAFIILAIIPAFCLAMLTGCGDGKPSVSARLQADSVLQPTDTPGDMPYSTPGGAPQVSDNNRHNTAVQAPSGDVIEINERIFIAQTNDVYYNPEDYLGKTIKYEGIFDVYTAPETGEKYYAVIRYGPGCCGNDGNVGFEVIWNNDYPNQDDWVEAVGILEDYEEGGFLYLRLALTSLTVLPVRGAENVSQ